MHVAPVSMSFAVSSPPAVSPPNTIAAAAAPSATAMTAIEGSGGWIGSMQHLLAKEAPAANALDLAILYLLLAHKAERDDENKTPILLSFESVQMNLTLHLDAHLPNTGMAAFGGMAGAAAIGTSVNFVA